jgi:hypothetical protein
VVRDRSDGAGSNPRTVNPRHAEVVHLFLDGFFSTSFPALHHLFKHKMADNWCTIESDPGTLGLLRFADYK